MSLNDGKRCRWMTLALGALVMSIASGCALGTTRVGITHLPLDEVKNKREGRILVKRFVDARTPEQRPYIGNKRNGYGMVLGHIGTLEGVELEKRLAECFADALREAGYDAVVEEAAASGEADYDAVLTGEIKTFWLDLYMAVWHSVDVHAQLHSSDMQTVLWESDLKGSETNVLWLGIRGEFSKVIMQALTKALNQAAEEFASDGFYQHIARKG